MSYPLNDGRYTGAGEETRTLDVHLGKVVLYQLSYARERAARSRAAAGSVNSYFP